MYNAIVLATLCSLGTMMNARAVAKKTSAGQNWSSAAKHLRLVSVEFVCWLPYKSQVQNPEEFKALQENASEQHA